MAISPMGSAGGYSPQMGGASNLNPYMALFNDPNFLSIFQQMLGKFFPTMGGGGGLKPEAPSPIGGAILPGGANGNVWGPSPPVPPGTAPGPQIAPARFPMQPKPTGIGTSPMPGQSKVLPAPPPLYPGSPGSPNIQPTQIGFNPGSPSIQLSSAGSRISPDKTGGAYWPAIGGAISGGSNFMPDGGVRKQQINPLAESSAYNPYR